MERISGETSEQFSARLKQRENRIKESKRWWKLMMMVPPPGFSLIFAFEKDYIPAIYFIILAIYFYLIFNLHNPKK